MLIEIKVRGTSRIIIAGEYESVKDCLEKNRRDVYFENADLIGSNLEGANLGGSNLIGANLGSSNLRYSNLGGANLVGSNLQGSNLQGANLGNANLVGIKGYANSHDIFSEIVSRQEAELFSDSEWVAIAQIIIYKLCWGSIRKRFSNVIPIIFKKLADAGFGEWLEHWELADE